MWDNLRDITKQEAAILYLVLLVIAVVVFLFIVAWPVAILLTAIAAFIVSLIWAFDKIIDDQAGNKPLFPNKKL